MTLFESLLFGIVQGLSEFLPISSTAHLLITQKLLAVPPGDTMFAFLVIIQLGTVVSLIIFFWNDLVNLLRAFFTRPFSSQENRLGWYILLATLPALLAGYLLKDLVESLFRAPLVEAAIRLGCAAILLILAEWLSKKSRKLDSMTWFDAIFIGLFQVIAVFPGASRSATTVSAGMLRGYERTSAARFAFLISIPIMIAAGAYTFLDILDVPNLGIFIPNLVVGFFTSAIIGWLAVKWFLSYLSKRSLYNFAVYCAIAGTICLILSFH